MEDLPTNLPGRLGARIHPGWLRIHSKKLEGAETDVCLREAYDVCATALRDCGDELDDTVLCKVIPSWVVHFAGAKEWFNDLPDDWGQWNEDLMKCLSSRIVYWQAEAVTLNQTAILGRCLAARIRAELLKIHSKHLEGADTDICLREAYDAFATAYRDFDLDLDDAILCEGIPVLILYAYGDHWLPAVPREQRYEDLLKRLSGRIAYWQAEALVLTEKLHPKGQSSLHERWESIKEMKRLIGGPHERIPENIVRTTIAQRYGIKAQDVTWEQIWLEVSRLQLIGGYRAVEIVPTDPATDEDLFGYRIPDGIWGAVTDHMEAMMAESEREIGLAAPSTADPNSPLKELDASPPTSPPSDEVRRLAKGLLDEYVLDPGCLTTTQPESQKVETVGGQINRLRNECRLTIEQLAEEIEVNRRTVERHLADNSTPHDRHLAAYERVFSKRLNRKVLIDKMP